MMLKYDIGDVIEIKHKNSEAVACLVLDIKKQHHFYEVNLLGRGKKFTIVDDGNFYTVKVLVNKDEKRITR